MTEPDKLEQLVIQIKKISESLAAEGPSPLPVSRIKRVRRTITEAYDTLRKVMEGLDPIKHPGFVFDPSNPNVAGRIVGITMIAQDRKPLVNLERFYGSGVYVLYYKGDFPAYAGIAARDNGKIDASCISFGRARQTVSLCRKASGCRNRFGSATFALNRPRFLRPWRGLRTQCSAGLYGTPVL